MASLDTPAEYALSAGEIAELETLLEGLRDIDVAPTATRFYDTLWTAAEELPRGLRTFLVEFRRTEPAASCLIHGFPVDDAEIGPTPANWELAGESKTTRDQEILLGLCGLVLGEPFTWATLQAGSLVQNILPIQGDERRQSGHGSETLLEFHTEDGFHPRRCDYLMLLGMRNHDRVPTILSSVRDIRLDDRDREILSQRRFHIVPDDEHVRQLAERAPDHPALREAQLMLERPEPVAILFGHRLNPYLRIDLPFTRCADGDTEARRAVRNLMSELERVQQDVPIGPGSLLVVDNHLAVHGRRPFQVRYDGTDRWLKKLTVSRNLRPGYSDRDADDHRVLF
ncbi:guanitoxin biosynthesis L-enduracididine beta-hydroxylase GntD [Streptomyces sp. NPDC047841]|uniref:guanitoxin biosynthesis L-enduracididine beta-hydroxylase GntD n=1 Tax=Streptomyces sp. NPDC047841 TaxID=3154708 RepID=UPI0034563455